MKRKCRKCGTAFEGRACGGCAVARTSAWRARNPERARELARDGARRLRHLHPDRLSDVNKRGYPRIQLWRKANADKVRAYNRKHIQKSGGAAQKRWAGANPLKVREFKARRRGLEQGAPVDYERVLATFGMICHICHEEIEVLADLEFDHVIPLSKGGEHSEGNIKPSHRRCNRRKSNNLLVRQTPKEAA